MLLHLITSTNASPCSPIMQFVHHIGCHKMKCAAGYKWSYESKTSWLLTAQFYAITSPSDSVLINICNYTLHEYYCVCMIIYEVFISNTKSFSIWTCSSQECKTTSSVNLFTVSYWWEDNQVQTSYRQVHRCSYESTTKFWYKLGKAECPRNN